MNYNEESFLKKLKLQAINQITNNIECMENIVLNDKWNLDTYNGYAKRFQCHVQEQLHLFYTMIEDMETKLQIEEHRNEVSCQSTVDYHIFIMKYYLESLNISIRLGYSYFGCHGHEEVYKLYKQKWVKWKKKWLEWYEIFKDYKAEHKKYKQLWSDLESFFNNEAKIEETRNNLEDSIDFDIAIENFQSYGKKMFYVDDKDTIDQRKRSYYLRIFKERLISYHNSLVNLCMNLSIIDDDKNHTAIDTKNASSELSQNNTRFKSTSIHLKNNLNKIISKYSQNKSPINNQFRFLSAPENNDRQEEENEELFRPFSKNEDNKETAHIHKWFDYLLNSIFNCGDGCDKIFNSVESQGKHRDEILERGRVIYKKKDTGKLISYNRFLIKLLKRIWYYIYWYNYKAKLQIKYCDDLKKNELKIINKIYIQINTNIKTYINITDRCIKDKFEEQIRVGQFLYLIFKVETFMERERVNIYRRIFSSTPHLHLTIKHLTFLNEKIIEGNSWNEFNEEVNNRQLVIKEWYESEEKEQVSMYDFIKDYSCKKELSYLNDTDKNINLCDYFTNKTKNEITDLKDENELLLSTDLQCETQFKCRYNKQIFTGNKYRKFCNSLTSEAESFLDQSQNDRNTNSEDCRYEIVEKIEPNDDHNDNMKHLAIVNSDKHEYLCLLKPRMYMENTVNDDLQVEIDQYRYQPFPINESNVEVHRKYIDEYLHNQEIEYDQVLLKDEQINQTETRLNLARRFYHSLIANSEYLMPSFLISNFNQCSICNVDKVTKFICKDVKDNFVYRGDRNSLPKFGWTYFNRKPIENDSNPTIQCTDATYIPIERDELGEIDINSYMVSVKELDDFYVCKPFSISGVLKFDLTSEDCFRCEPYDDDLVFQSYTIRKVFNQKIKVENVQNIYLNLSINQKKESNIYNEKFDKIITKYDYSKAGDKNNRFKGGSKNLFNNKMKKIQINYEEERKINKIYKLTKISPMYTTRFMKEKLTDCVFNSDDKVKSILNQAPYEIEDILKISKEIIKRSNDRSKKVTERKKQNEEILAKINKKLIEDNDKNNDETINSNSTINYSDLKYKEYSENIEFDQDSSIPKETNDKFINESRCNFKYSTISGSIYSDNCIYMKNKSDDINWKYSYIVYFRIDKRHVKINIPNRYYSFANWESYYGVALCDSTNILSGVLNASAYQSKQKNIFHRYDIDQAIMEGMEELYAKNQFIYRYEVPIAQFDFKDCLLQCDYNYYLMLINSGYSKEYVDNKINETYNDYTYYDVYA